MACRARTGSRAKATPQTATAAQTARIFIRIECSAALQALKHVGDRDGAFAKAQRDGIAGLVFARGVILAADTDRSRLPVDDPEFSGSISAEKPDVHIEFAHFV